MQLFIIKAKRKITKNKLELKRLVIKFLNWLKKKHSKRSKRKRTKSLAKTFLKEKPFGLRNSHGSSLLKVFL